MFKKIGRFAKNVIKGAGKSLPFINVFGELKDLNLKKKAKQFKDMHKTDTQSNLKASLYMLADLIDDGKQNQSFSEDVFDKLVQLFSGLATSAGIIYWIIQNL